MEIVRSDGDGEFIGKAFNDVYKYHRIKRELSAEDASQFNGVAERAFGIIETTAKAACIEAPLLFPGATVPDFTASDYLWGEVMLWAYNSLNCMATIVNPPRNAFREK